jgi:hypothetical protein
MSLPARYRYLLVLIILAVSYLGSSSPSVRADEECTEESCCGEEDPHGNSELVYPNDISMWESAPMPDQSRVGDCAGNCGAGCSDTFDVCNGAEQYWEMEYLSGPDSQSICVVGCDGDDTVIREFQGYQAAVRWTYHGWLQEGCSFHDSYCSQWNPACLLFTGCWGSGESHTWSYDDTLTRITSNELSSVVVGNGVGVCAWGQHPSNTVSCSEMSQYLNPPPDMQANSAVRGCSDYVELPPESFGSPETCRDWCRYVGGDACEWNSGDCYVEYGNGCYVESGFSGWYAAVMH